MTIATQRLYLTADRETVVGHGDPGAAFLLCATGQEIPKDAPEIPAHLLATDDAIADFAEAVSELPAEEMATIIADIEAGANDEGADAVAEPEEKAAEPPANKAGAKPANKGRKRS